ncbi:MAG: hypothetical protein GEV11_01785 [Streptosporangiales bacterium]|nr:hypothetical protein [Streptosporangiales bacterium]
MFGSALGKGARRRVTTAVVALAAGAALVACGPVKAGAAAIVGDDRITTAELDKRVAQWHEAIKGTELEGQLDQIAAMRVQRPNEVPDLRLPRDMLNQLILFRLADTLAERRGVTISRSETDAYMQKNRSTLPRDVLVTPLPPSETQAYVRFSLISDKFLGPMPQVRSQEELDAELQKRWQRLTALLRPIAEDIGVTADPRYGDFQPSSLRLVETDDRLSRAG